MSNETIREMNEFLDFLDYRWYGIRSKGEARAFLQSYEDYASRATDGIMAMITSGGQVESLTTALPPGVTEHRQFIVDYLGFKDAKTGGMAAPALDGSEVSESRWQTVALMTLGSAHFLFFGSLAALFVAAVVLVIVSIVVGVAE